MHNFLFALLNLSEIEIYKKKKEIYNVLIYFLSSFCSIFNFRWINEKNENRKILTY